MDKEIEYKHFKPDKLPLANLDWRKFIGLIGKANAEVARFDGLLDSILNPAVLLSPLTTKEAVLSSRIEGTQATMRDVLEFEADPLKQTKKYDDIQEVLNYRKAMNFAIKEMRSIGFTLRLLREMHAILLSGVRGKERDPGNFRREDVYVGMPGKPRYVPPKHQDITEHLKNFEIYANSNDQDFVVQLAIIHAQFEIIHPFADGNGRMGRIIMPLFLYHKDVLSTPMLYLSEYFEMHRDEYYKRLQDISDNGNWEDWIIYFLEAVIQQSRQNIKKAKEIQSLYNQKKQRIKELTHSQFSIDTLDFLFKNPIFSATQFRDGSSIPKASVGRILQILTKGEVVKILEKGSGKRPTKYAFIKLLKIID